VQRYEMEFLQEWERGLEKGEKRQKGNQLLRGGKQDKDVFPACLLQHCLGEFFVGEVAGKESGREQGEGKRKKEREKWKARVQPQIVVK